jgi:hypothetical protein
MDWSSLWTKTMVQVPESYFLGYKFGLQYNQDRPLDGNGNQPSWFRFQREDACLMYAQLTKISWSWHILDLIV